MLQAHSILWHYLWVAPSVLLLILSFRLWRLKIHRQHPAFLALALASAVEQLALYVCDLAPSVTPNTWWHVFWLGLVIEGLLKFVLIGEIFVHAFQSYPAIAKLGRLMIAGVGATMIFASALAAAYAPPDSIFGIVSGAHLLEQTIYLVECGLLVFIFLFSGYFQLRIARPDFGIALGLGISACVHLASWALLANGGLPTEKRVALDFLNMATYHVCVLIWFYYLLAPQKMTAAEALPALPDHNLDLWNRELERLIHQ